MSVRTEKLLERIVARLDRVILALERLGPGPSLGRHRAQAGWKHRPHHRAFRSLPEPAQERAVAGFAAGESTTAIARALTTSGASIPISSLNRYRQWWEANNGRAPAPRLTRAR